MTAMRYTVTGLALSLALFAFANTTPAADKGLVTEQSRYSVKETVARFEAAVKAKESLGFTVFTEIVPYDQYQRPSTAMRQTNSNVEPPV